MVAIVPFGVSDLAELNRLLKEALELPPPERDAWLHALAVDYARFASTLRRLLELADAPETFDFLRTLPKFDQDSALELDAVEGGTIGPYRLLRQLGAGGMASVWLAERADGAMQRKVALKLPLVGLRALSADVLARERDLHAALEHPNIARLYDAGVAADGQSYLALEYVDGEPIDVYCKARALDVRAVLGLFVQVTHAVAFAHANLILHRDLKPSNILVTPEGQVRLLDFGIAKLLEGTERASALTQVGRALTPDYASPEQILGQPLAVTSDVYTLGVVLYELLAGARPYRIKRESLGALEDAILSVDPPAPSTTVTDPARRRLIAGDLDTIVQKALKKAPAERYATALALADDIERLLDGRPVLARPDRFAYRARKFVLRNKLAVGAGGAVLLALAAGVAGTAWQAVEARRERDHAVFEADRALAKSKMFSLLLGALGDAKRPLTQREILDRSTVLVERQYADDPRIAIDLLLPIAGQYMTLGEAQAELDVEQRAAALARKSGDPELIALVACNTVETYLALDRRDEAREQLRVGRDALARVAQPPVGVVLDCLNAEAGIARLDGDLDRAIALVTEGVHRAEQARQTRGNRYTSSLSRLVFLHRMHGDLRASNAVLEKVTSTYEAEGSGASMDALTMRLEEAVNLMAFGEYRAARERLDDVAARWRAANGDAPLPSRFAFVDGAALFELGELEAARRTLEQAADRARAEAGASIPIDYVRAQVLVALGRYDAAEDLLAAIEKTKPLATVLSRMTPATLRAQIALGRGAPQEAARMLEDELVRLGYPRGKDTNALVLALMTGASAYLAANDPARARPLAAAAEAMAERIAREPGHSARAGAAALLLARAERALGETAVAADTARRSEAELSSGLGPDHALTHEAHALSGT